MSRKLASGILACFIFSVFSFITAACAQDPELVALIRGLQKQMSELQATVQSQQVELQELKARGANVQGGSASVETLPSMSESEFKARLTDATGGANKWLEGLKFSGDLRMRYEGVSNAQATAADLNRFRFRLRYGFEKKFSDEFKVGFRLASGSLTDPTSTNQTFDNAYSNKMITIDQAYAIYNPKWALLGSISDVEIGVGKVANPLSDIHSWLTWDSDVTPEGLYEKVTVGILKNEHWTSDVEFLGTQFVINQGGAHQNSEFFGFSGGLRNEFTHQDLKHPISFRTYANYELSRDLQNTSQNAQLGLGSYRTNNFTNGNNTGDLGVLSFYHELGWRIDPLPKFKLFFEHGENTAAHMANADQRHLYAVGAQLGKAKKKGTWEFGYTYGHLETNSTYGIWADSDFGFTNRKGSVVKAGYALTDYLTLHGAAFFTQNIVDGVNNSPNSQQLFQLDMVWKF